MFHYIVRLIPSYQGKQTSYFWIFLYIYLFIYLFILFSGNYFRGMPNSHYRTPSFGNLSNSSSSDDVIDMMMVGGGKPLTNSSYSFDDWHFNFMTQQQQQSAPTTTTTTTTTNTIQPHQIIPQFPPSHDDFYGGLTSGLMNLDLHHPSLYNNTQCQSQSQSQSQQQQYSLSQLKFGNAYQFQDAQLQQQPPQQHDPRNDVERLGFESRFLPNYGEYMFQMPNSGDVYNTRTHTRVFGM